MYEIITDYLLVLAKVTPKQCSGAILIKDFKMQAASFVSVKWRTINFGLASCGSGNFRFVSYNSISLWIASCELIIRLWVVSWEPGIYPGSFTDVCFWAMIVFECFKMQVGVLRYCKFCKGFMTEYCWGFRG